MKKLTQSQLEKERIGREERHAVLKHQSAEMAVKMSRSYFADPVGFLVIPDTPYGEQIVRAMGDLGDLDPKEAREFTRRQREIGKIPAVHVVVPIDMARQLLETTSSTASQSLSMARKPGQHFVVVIGYGGNSYGLVELKRINPQDGQNRVKF